MQYIQFYRGAVIALSKGKLGLFDMAKSKPRVRQGRDADGYSPRLKVIEQSRKQAAINRMLRRHLQLAEKYTMDTCQVRSSSYGTVQSGIHGAIGAT